MYKRSFNDITLLVFASLLILTGIAGFLLSADKSLTSGAPLYNIFHIFFGCLGLLIGAARKQWLTESFNIGFGLIDLYQAFASYAQLFPARFFRWTPFDDWLHIIIGLALVIIGFYGAIKRR
jgi:hypothetical protein